MRREMSSNSETSIETRKVRQRRKEARPAEIVEIALACVLENGFEATKLDEVARHANVARGTVYLYFEKEQLFRAVVREAASTNLKGLATAASAFEWSLEELVPLLLSRMVQTVATSRAPAIARLILREVDRIPDLARIWFEDVVSPLLTMLEGIAVKARERGEIREGIPRLQIFSILGPVVVGIRFSEILGRLGYEAVDLPRLAQQHGEAVLYGLLGSPGGSSSAPPKGKGRRPRR
jgi:AcrR family transcriptional regulator